MEELFRLMVIRPGDTDALDPESRNYVHLSNNSHFVDELRGARNSVQRKSAAEAFEESGDFIQKVEDLSLGTVLLGIATRYNRENGQNLDRDALILAIAGELETAMSANGNTGTVAAATSWLQTLIQDQGWTDAQEKLQNTILAIRELNKYPRLMISLTSILHAQSMIEALVEASETHFNAAKHFGKPLYLSGVRDQTSEVVLPSRVPEDPQIELDRIQFKKLSKAASELMNAPLEDMEYRVTTEVEIRGGDPNSTRINDSTKIQKETERASISTTAIQQFSSETQSLLGDLGVVAGETALDLAMDKIRAKQNSFATSMKKEGTSFINGSKVGKTLTDKAAEELFKTLEPDWLQYFLPQTTGNISPAGVGDLLVVKQQLKRYENGEVAHIENVLQGELREREHRKRRYSEDTTSTTTETEVAESQETQTTNRFELSQEVKRKVDTELKAEAGVKVSAKYGPSVKVTADAQFSYSNAKSESTAKANSMVREVVEKASQSYKEKMSRTVTRKLINEMEEINKHSVDGTGASEHIVGVYQWVNKVYEAQMYNYGLRVMYDFMVPEPAAWYLWSARKAANEEKAPTAPLPFFVSPDDIDEYNYRDLIALFEASDVIAPPDPFITQGMSKSGGPTPEPGPISDFDTIVIPEGYEYLGYESYNLINGLTGDETDDDASGFEAIISHAFKAPGQVQVIISGYGLTSWTFSVNVLCRRTAISFENWQIKVWEALHTGHARQMAIYEEKMASMVLDEGIHIEGRNPHFNRQIEETEIQKSCLALLTGTYPGWINSIVETEAGPVPQATFSSMQGAYVRFFMQAFEWENMSYLFYPYYWARAAKWRELLSLEDVDAQFQKFLTAGFARVSVPVRPAFQRAVEHYRQTGQIWSGGKLPDITDGDYLPIALEVKAAQDGLGKEVPVGEPWDVVVPTSLVKLRPDNSLPTWEKNTDGSWTETV